MFGCCGRHLGASDEQFARVFFAAFGLMRLVPGRTRASGNSAPATDQTQPESTTIRRYLRAGLIDELHLTIAPVLPGSVESLFFGIDRRAPGYRCVEHKATDKETHVVLGTA